MPASVSQIDRVPTGQRPHVAFAAASPSSRGLDRAEGTIATGEVGATEQLAAIVELTTALQTQESALGACRVLAVELARFLDVEQVVIGFCPQPGGRCQVAAISDADTFDPASPAVRLIQAALDESILRGAATRWPPSEADSPHALLAHRQYAEECDAPTLVSGPLLEESGAARGAWLCVPREAEQATVVQRFLDAAAPAVATTLALLKRSERSATWRQLQTLGERLRAGGWKTSCGVVAAAVFIGCWPMPHSISCSCELEPVTRRHVAAPFAGPLEKALVEPGDFVRKDQVLAQMDGREVRWELAGVRAEYHRAAKERVGHLATHESGKAELARYDVDRLKLRQELLEHRDQNLLIRSPIDGVVVSGDLKRSEGMPLTTGQNLFEIAPLDEMVVEVAVSAADIAYIRSGMPVTIRLDGAPWQRWTATLGRVQPRAELREHENVFVAEVRLDNAADQLRPGMRGRAEIGAGRMPWGWQWLRKPLAAAISWLGW